MFCSFLSFSQENKILDSLEKQISYTISDTSIVKSLFNEVKKYYYNDNNYAKRCIDISLDLLQKIVYPKGEIIMNLILSQYYIDKGKEDSAMLILSNLEVLSIELKDTFHLAKVWSNKGQILYGQSKIGEARDYFLKALPIFEKNNSRSYAPTLNMIGFSYLDQDNTEQALLCFLKADSVTEVEKYHSLNANIKLSISNVYVAMNDYDKAQEVLVLAVLKLKENGIEGSAGKGAILMQLTNVCNELKEFEKAKKYGEEAKQILMKLDFKDQIIQLNGMLGDVALGRKDYKEAEKCYSQMLYDSEKQEYNNRVASAYYGLGDVYFKMNNYQKSEYYFLKALNKSGKSNVNGVYRNTLLSLSELNYILGNYKKAFDYKKSYKVIVDSVRTIEKEKAINDINVKYETEKKDKEIGELAAQNEIASLEITNKSLALTQRNYLLLGLGGLLLLLAIVGYLFYQQNKIKNQQQTAQLEQKLLRTQMNPHFMSNSLMSIQTYMYENNTQDAALYLGKFGKLTRQILDASRQDYIPLEEEVTFIKNYLDFQQLMFPNKLNYVVKIDESIEDAEDLMIPPMLSQPFIENAIEHGIRHLQDSKGNVSVVFKQQNENLVLEIEDNGIGRKHAHNINAQVKSNHTSHSTSITQERIELFKKKHKQHIMFNILDQEIGTKVRFEMPLIYG